jgi:hypothetical protein
MEGAQMAGVWDLSAEENIQRGKVTGLRVFENEMLGRIHR